MRTGDLHTKHRDNVVMRTPCIWLTLAAFCTLPVALTSGCTGSQLEREWDVSVEETLGDPLVVESYFPKNDLLGIGRQIKPYFFFNRPLVLEEEAGLLDAVTDLELVRTNTGQSAELDGELDFDGMGVRFFPDVLISPSTYEMRLHAEDVEDDTQLSSVFHTALPEGIRFNLSSDLHVESFGGNRSHAGLLNSLFDPGVYPLWVLVFTGIDSADDLPATTDAQFGPAYIRERNQHVRIYREFGLSSVFRDVEIAADGSFEVEQPGVFLPLDNVDGIIILYLEDVTFRGQFDFSGPSPVIRDAELSGIFTTRWLRKLGENGGGWSLAVNAAELDVDQNGNGRPDSATFTLRSEPTAIDPAEIDP